MHARRAPCTRGGQAPGYVAVRGGNIYWANASIVALSAKDPPYAVMTACK